MSLKMNWSEPIAHRVIGESHNATLVPLNGTIGAGADWKTVTMAHNAVVRHGIQGHC